MYDIKSIEAGKSTNQHIEFVTSTFYENLQNNYKQRHTTTNTTNINNSNSSNNTNNNNTNYNLSNNKNNNNCNSISSQIPENNTMFLTFRRRRIFNRQTCLISIMAAFIFGLSLGVFLPMVSMTASAFTTELIPSSQQPQANNLKLQSNNNDNSDSVDIVDDNSEHLYNNNNNIQQQYLKIATTLITSNNENNNNIVLQANKTSLNNIKSNTNHNNNNNNHIINDDSNSRQYNSFIPKHPASDFPTIYELKQQQQQEQQQQQQQIDSNNRNGDTQENNAASADYISDHDHDSLTSNSNGFSVTFVKEKKLPVEEIFRNAFHLEQDKSSIDTMIVKKLNDANDGSIKEFLQQQQHTNKNSIHRRNKGLQHHILSSSSIEETLLKNDNNDDHIDGTASKINSSDNKKSSINYNDDDFIKLDQKQQQQQQHQKLNLNSDSGSVNFVTVKLKNSIKKQSHSSMNDNSNNNEYNHNSNNNNNNNHYQYHDTELNNNENNERDQYEKHNFIKNDIYWGDIVETAIPKGYNHDDIENWNYYIQNTGIVKTLENGCGRMQNRLVIFNDGRRACARYRQNTDQIQGELFSFYLGQLLNLTNLAPSAASVINFKYDTWSFAQQDLQNAQWKETRPVVLTKWLPNLEPAGIPIPFQPLERHLNKYDVWNITLSTMMESKKILLINQKQEKNIFEQENEKLIKDIQNIQQQQQQKEEEQNEHNHHQYDRKLPQQKKYHENLNNKILNKYHYTQPQQQQQQQQQNQQNINEYQQNIQQEKDKKGLLERLGANRFNNDNQSSKKSADLISIDSTITSNNKYHDINIESLINHSGNININNNNNNSEYNIKNQSIQINQTNLIIKRLIELAQWSDLIIFDYLIANLDRVVNNLYNYQWNSDIMAAPAHNLARQIDSQLLIFLDNESGLLHGYRLLKKYEAYHSLLLDNLCVFREPTINALKRIKEIGIGQLLQDIFEQSTSHQLRDVLPSLPDKSIKILNDRIDRVLGQVQKCQNLFSNNR